MVERRYAREPVYEDPRYEAIFDVAAGVLIWRCRECARTQPGQIGRDFSVQYPTQPPDGSKFPHARECKYSTTRTVAVSTASRSPARREIPARQDSASVSRGRLVRIRETIMTALAAFATFIDRTAVVGLLAVSVIAVAILTDRFWPVVVVLVAGALALAVLRRAWPVIVTFWLVIFGYFVAGLFGAFIGLCTTLVLIALETRPDAHLSSKRR